jgi:hypothetical protein
VRSIIPGLEAEHLPRTTLEYVSCGGEGDAGGEQEDNENRRRLYGKSKSEPKPEEELGSGDDVEQDGSEEDGRDNDQGRGDEYAGDDDEAGADELASCDGSESIEGCVGSRGSMNAEVDGPDVLRREDDDKSAFMGKKAFASRVLV